MISYLTLTWLTDQPFFIAVIGFMFSTYFLFSIFFMKNIKSILFLNIFLLVNSITLSFVFFFILANIFSVNLYIGLIITFVFFTFIYFSQKVYLNISTNESAIKKKIAYNKQKKRKAIAGIRLDNYRSSPIHFVGEEVSDTNEKICPECKSEIDDETIFCHCCGLYISEFEQDGES